MSIVDNSIFTKGENVDLLYKDKSIDFIIMDHIDEGLIYFNKCLELVGKNYSSHHQKYLSNYIIVYIKNTFNYTKFIENLKIINKFHYNLVTTDILGDQIDIWLRCIYTYILKYYKTPSKNLDYNILKNLIDCEKFRQFFYSKEFLYSSKNLETNTILGSIIYNLDNITVKNLENILYNVILKNDYENKNFFYEWIKFIYNINGIRILDPDTSQVEINSDIFMINLIEFTNRIWYKFYQFNSCIQGIKAKNLGYYLLKLIDITIIPVINCQTHYKERLIELEEFTTNNRTLYQLQFKLKDKLKEIENILQRKRYIFNGLIRFMDWLSNMLLAKSVEYIYIQNDFSKIIIDFFIHSVDYYDNIPQSVEQLSKKLLVYYQDNDKVINSSNGSSDNNNHITNIPLIYYAYQFQFTLLKKSQSLDENILENVFLKLYFDISKYNSSHRYKYLKNTLINQDKFEISKLYSNKPLIFLKMFIGDVNEAFDVINEKNNLFIKNYKLLSENSLDSQNKLFNELTIFFDLIISIINNNQEEDYSSLNNCINNFIIYNLNTLSNFYKLNNLLTDICEYKNLHIITGKIIEIISFFIQFKNFKEIFNSNNLKNCIILESADLEEETKKKINEIFDLSEKKIDFPDEFCDPLLFTEIKHPVIIPETDIFMDKSVIENYVTDYKLNPFSRNPLTIEQLNSYNSQTEIVLKVNEFLNKKSAWLNENQS